MSSSTLTIKELNGKRRHIELRGGALPVKGAKWTTGNALDTSVNPGNTESTQHVLGPREMPSDWTFRWSTVVLSRTPITFNDSGVVKTIDTAEELRLALDSMLYGSALLEVVWIASNRSAQSVRQVRVGRCSEWSAAYDTADDIYGTARFDWIARGATQPKVSSIQGNGLIASLRKAQISANDAAITAFARDLHRSTQTNIETVDPATTFTLDDIEALIDAPREMMDQFARAANGVTDRFKQLGELVIKVKETPAALFSRALDVANNAVAVANTFADEIGREGPETMSAKTNAYLLARNTGMTGLAQLAALEMGATSEEVAEQARTRRSGSVSSAGSSRRQDRVRSDDVLVTYIPLATDTMYTISQKHYGTADLAPEIARVNGLPAYTVTPPRMALIIPSRRSLEEQSRDRI